MEIHSYHQVDYKFLKHMFTKFTPTEAIELRDWISLAIKEDDWEFQRDYTHVVWLSLSEALWHAEEIEDYEFCAKLYPLTNSWFDYSEKLDEELEHYD